ncbi:Pentatricopeptide repeat-containing protein At4g36680, mitochondrial [Olea europaea subsp. europaea]|uniref:Pentatricopeptide repeat-containing protein At4g36680, mitochondrial n=1 Tax=Olea europaea subsp. europaea TaxID=158383 RepID=A0A8S0TKG2_OLEEU|nr:Pentatricopeptide repeat-containing protein At4g36680, mitochondrial [Olea europaea subsp. europaea]
MNPLDTAIAQKDTPKLAMQLSKPFILQSYKNRFKLFQKMAAIGLEELSSQILSLMPLDELIAIIQGRNKESAARTVTAVKSMVTAMNSGRKERISTRIWNVSEAPLTIDDILAFSMQKIEVNAIDALKIQTGKAEEDAPFDASPIDAKTIGVNVKVYNHPLASAVPTEDRIRVSSTKCPDDASDPPALTLSAVVQLCNAMRQYEAVCGPIVALIHAMQFTIRLIVTMRRQDTK